MIILTSTDKLQVKLAGTVAANQLECFASYRETTSTTITPGRNFSNTNNTTAIDLIGSPGASTQRVVDYVSIYNADTATATVTVQFDVSGTAYQLIVASLAAGEKLEYQEGIGFKSLDINGAVKTGNEMGYNNMTGISSTTTSTDVTNNNAVANTIADITGLSFSVTSGKTYWFRFTINYTSAASTTGARFSINGPTTSALYFYSTSGLSTVGQYINQGLNAYDTPAAASTTTPTTLVAIATVEGIATFSANGTLIGRFASEVSNSAVVVKAGSVVHYRQLD